MPYIHEQLQAFFQASLWHSGCQMWLQLGLFVSRLILTATILLSRLESPVLPLPLLCVCRLSSPPETRTHQAAAGAAHTQQQQQQSPSGLAGPTAAAARSSSPTDDLRLMRPVDPTNPSYYWKPLPGADGKAATAAAAPAGRTIDRILGAQVCGACVTCRLLGNATHSFCSRHCLTAIPILLHVPPARHAHHAVNQTLTITHCQSKLSKRMFGGKPGAIRCIQGCMCV